MSKRKYAPHTNLLAATQPKKTSKQTRFSTEIASSTVTVSWGEVSMPESCYDRCNGILGWVELVAPHFRVHSNPAQAYFELKEEFGSAAIGRALSFDDFSADLEGKRSSEFYMTSVKV